MFLQNRNGEQNAARCKWCSKQISVSHFTKINLCVSCSQLQNESKQRETKISNVFMPSNSDSKMTFGNSLLAKHKNNLKINTNNKPIGNHRCCNQCTSKHIFYQGRKIYDTGGVWPMDCSN